MAGSAPRILCPSCGQESAVKWVKKYEGFTEVGTVKTCAFCGYEFGEEEPEYCGNEAPAWTRDKTLKKICRRCRHYVLNPFAQKCGLTQQEVEATDSCGRFQPRPQPPPKTKKADSPESIFGD